MTKINHNDTNLNNFNEIMRHREELLEKSDNDNRKEQLKNNLLNWLNTVPENYKRARLPLFKQNVLVSIKPSLQQNKLPYRLLVHGSHPNNNEAYVYSILRYSIAHGIINPSDIRWSGLQEGAEGVTGGFQKQEWRDKFFDKSAKVFIIKGLSKQFAELNITGTEKFLGMFSQFINENHKTAIIIYNDDFKEDKDIQLGRKWVPKFSINSGTIASILTRHSTQAYLPMNSLK